MHSLSVRACSLLALSLVLSACSVLTEDKVNYKTTVVAPTLEVPPDLTQLRKDSRYAIESTSATALGFQSAAKRVVDNGTAANSIGDVRMERAGAQRWLVVSRPADKVWEALQEFWTGNGFTLTTDAPDLGIMETEWAENRAKLPQDLLRQALGKILDSVYSTGERDRYRTRVERLSQGGVEIHIAHRGLVEDYKDSTRISTVWKPRPSDPELEIEFLRRLMVKLGTPEAVATASTSAALVDAGKQALSTLDGIVSLVLPDELDRGWRRIGVALDRAGFTVEDRDRSKGLYFVRYVLAATAEKEPGWFARLFSSSKEGSTLARYRIALSAGKDATSTVVRVLNAEGQTENSATAEKILKLISSEMR